MDVFFDWRWLFIKKYNSIWDKVSADIRKEFDNEPVYNTKYLKTIITSHGDEYFYNNKFLR